MKPIIYDSTFRTESYSVEDNVPNRSDKSTDRVLQNGFKFFNPVNASNVRVQRNIQSSQLRHISYVDTNKLRIVYFLQPTRCISPRPGPPCTPPPSNIKIDFDVKTYKYGLKTVSPKKQKFNSSVETVFITEYDLFPSGKWELRGWTYSSLVKIFKNGRLYRQYEVTDEIPELRNKVVSYIAGDKKLVVEVLEQF